MNLEWEILERKPFEDHRIFKIQTKIVRSPGTGAAMEVKAISASDWVLTLPVTARGEVVMVRQYRHGIEEICLELPGGLVDREDASPEAAARRELREETGYEAMDYVSMGSCFPQPAVFGNRCFFFFAGDAHLVCQPKPDEGEEIEVVLLPLDEIPELIQNGRISNGIVQLAFYRYFMDRGISAKLDKSI